MSQVLVADDFSGGITDNHISSPPNKYEKADNLLIVQHKDKGKLISRPGSALYDSANPQLPTGNQRVGKLKIFGNYLFAQSGRNIYYSNSGYNSLLGPFTSNTPFSSSFTTANRISWAEFNNHLYVANDNFDYILKIYPNASGVPVLRTAGLPALATTPTLAGSAGAQSFVYRFIYSYTYQVNTLTFLDEGSYKQAAITSIAAPNVSSITASGIPVLSNGSTGNWDTDAGIVVNIYRTTNGGTVFYLVGGVGNGVTSFVDSVSDATLVGNPLMYTEGGVPQNDIPPFAKFITITGDNGIAWYAHIKEGTEIKKNRVRQSSPGDPDSCPATFYVDLAEDIVGISSVKGFPIVICNKAAYRLEGFFDDVGQGGIEAVKISDTADCIANNSIVQTLEGIFWCGRSGIYGCDGYKVVRINNEWDEGTYKDLVTTTTQQSFVEGDYDKASKRIWWTFQQASSANGDADKCYVLDLNWGLSDDMPFTSVSNGSFFLPSAVTFNSDGQLIRGDKRGYVLIHDKNTLSDPKIDTTITPSSWEKVYIPYDFKSSGYDMGSTLQRKYVTKMILTCKNITNLSTQIISNNDANRKIEDLSLIRFRGNLVWSDPLPIWGDDSIIWNFDGLIEVQRYFPSNSLRCSYKQIEITNGYVNIFNSDYLGTAVVNGASNTATLTSSATINWPSDLVDYFISFENDGYIADYKIIARTNSLITFLDSANRAPTGTQQWVIRGFPKDEAINILSFTLMYDVFGVTQPYYKNSGSGAVGT